MSIEGAVVTIDAMGCQYEIAKKIIDKKGGLPLAPPTDWRRDAPLTFSCAHCRELSHFLADPAQKEWASRFSLPSMAQSDRRHHGALRRAYKPVMIEA